MQFLADVFDVGLYGFCADSQLIRDLLYTKPAQNLILLFISTCSTQDCAERSRRRNCGNGRTSREVGMTKFGKFDNVILNVYTQAQKEIK